MTRDHHREKHRQLETILALSWANEGESSAVLGHVGSSWGVLEASWGSPRPSWGNLGGVLALLEAILSSSWPPWGTHTHTAHTTHTTNKTHNMIGRGSPPHRNPGGSPPCVNAASNVCLHIWMSEFLSCFNSSACLVTSLLIKRR